MVLCSISDSPRAHIGFFGADVRKARKFSAAVSMQIAGRRRRGSLADSLATPERYRTAGLEEADDSPYGLASRGLAIVRFHVDISHSRLHARDFFHRLGFQWVAFGVLHHVSLGRLREHAALQKTRRGI